MNIDFDKSEGLMPAIVQDAVTKNVLMLAYMNEEAYKKTLETKHASFFCKTRKRLWTKGEESGNFMNLVEIKPNCNRDALLVLVNPTGPACKTGDETCWEEKNTDSFGFLSQLEQVIIDRKNNPSDKSYTSSLFDKGINKIAQKVGEEAVELVIESKDNDKDLFLNEGADLIYHFLVLLQAKEFNLSDIVDVLRERHK